MGKFMILCRVMEHLRIWQHSACLIVTFPEELNGVCLPPEVIAIHISSLIDV